MAVFLASSKSGRDHWEVEILGRNLTKSVARDKKIKFQEFLVGQGNFSYFGLRTQMIKPGELGWIGTQPVLEGTEVTLWIFSIPKIELKAIPYGNESHKKFTTAKHKV